MPPKGKPNKNPGKRTEGPPKLNESDSNSTTSLSPELEQQFEVELCWCIQQLQTALKSGKLNNKQVQDHTKALNTLMSNSTPMIKKRQVMRLSFGDYRAKMAAEEKKCSKINMRVKPAMPSKKSQFMRKSTFMSSSGNVFRFNFETPNNDELSNGLQSVEINSSETSSQSQKDFKFAPSDNSFRFSFDVSENS